MTDEDYDMLISHSRESCGKRGIDKTLKENDVDVILSIGDSFLIGTVAGAGLSDDAERIENSENSLHDRDRIPGGHAAP